MALLCRRCAGWCSSGFAGVRSTVRCVVLRAKSSYHVALCEKKEQNYCCFALHSKFSAGGKAKSYATFPAKEVVTWLWQRTGITGSTGSGLT